MLEAALDLARAYPAALILAAIVVSAIFATLTYDLL